MPDIGLIEARKCIACGMCAMVCPFDVITYSPTKAAPEKIVDIRLNTKARRFVGNHRAAGVELKSGQLIQADILIAATGVRPNLDFLEGSGIHHRWGITVDDHLRTTTSDIYAAGDVIEAPDRLTGETYVHAILPNAVEQGRVVGLNLAGIDTLYDGTERMNSLKHLGVPVMAVGLKQGDEVLRARVDGGNRTLYLQENRLVGYQLIGDLRAAGALRALLYRQEDVSKVKDRLLETNSGQGALAWAAMAL